MSNTFYNFKLDLEPNLIDMIYDILRMSTIQLVTQIMFYMNNSSLSLFSETFIKTLVFINFGIIVYYLLIRKLFSFVSDDYLRVIDNNYRQTPPMNTATPDNLHKSPKENVRTDDRQPLGQSSVENVSAVKTVAADIIPKPQYNTPINSTRGPTKTNNSIIKH